MNKNNSEILRGGCECGHVRYEVRGAVYHSTLCHCATCRRVAGAPAVAWFSARPEHFHVLRGAMQAYRSSSRATRSFCPICGTHLIFVQDGLAEVDVTTCSLDDPNRVPPADETFVRSQLAWMEASASRPRHPTTRDADPTA